ncbi:MAG: Holliday junction resolvase-like protein [Gemmatimonadales bacterium]
MSIHIDPLALVLGLAAIVLAFLAWKARYTRTVRRDPIQRSLAVTAGKVYEQVVPYLPGFHFNPKDARFLGTPVDFVVFDGLSDGAVERVVFVEVKTGAADLSARERRVRDAVQSRQVEWLELRVPPSSPPG